MLTIEIRLMQPGERIKKSLLSHFDRLHLLLDFGLKQKGDRQGVYDQRLYQGKTYDHRCLYF